ncbi:MAG: rod shape-determining protein MreD [Bacteroidota bacterium]|nr:rod shape-determining protein MreD [Bacteroidota bacterium]
MTRLQIGRATRWGVLFAALVILQVVFAPLLALWGVTPDFVLVGLLFLAALEGRLPAVLTGFSTGIVLDIAAGEVIGLSALAKTLAGFTAGFQFQPHLEGQRIRPVIFMLYAAGVSVLHNLIFLLSYFRSLNISLLSLLFSHCFGAALYHTFIAAIVLLIISRRKQGIAMEARP